jgi:hypothetical protein
MDETHYVPILQAKAGELSALASLASDVKAAMTPLLEVPPVPWDWENDEPAKTLGEHLDPVAGNLRTSWGTEHPLLVDLLFIEDDEIDGQHPIDFVFERARSHGVLAIPVTGQRRSAAYQNAVRRIVASDGRGLCLRLESEDFQADNPGQTIMELLGTLGVQPADVTVLIDLGPISPDQSGTIALATKAMLSALPHMQQWRDLVLAGSSFPPNLSDFAADTVGSVAREEWSVWQAIRTAARATRVPTFGDYAIAHPDPTVSDVDPRLIQMSANIRYTTDASWLIFKGRGVRLQGFAQFHALAREVTKHPAYSGPTFSWGDEFIAQCAQGRSTGNATTWRKVGTSHHVTFAVRQLARLAAGS